MQHSGELLMSSATTLRDVQPDDEVFLFDVYASTRADELALTGWTADQQAAFLHMQFNAQRQHYHAQFPDAKYYVIQRDGIAVGRLIVHRTDHELRLMDIALLPEYRDAGIGTLLLRDLIAEAARTGRLLRLHVEMFNRARLWYERLGFRQIQEAGLYLEMEWRASAE
jgi:ribosomal protein S18 acetylase RimI-like enzyme